MWDPREVRCDCDRCPLREDREGPPVPGEFPSNPIALLVGEAPGESEVSKGAPFVGKAGVELMNGLAAVGVRRNQIALSNVVACRPPENKYDLILHRVQKENKKREREGLELIPTPAQCCRPRLVAEAAAIPKIIALGGTAMKALVGQGSIMEQRGAPRESAIEVEPGRVVPLRVLPTLHPSFVMRARRWRGPFRADLARAFRWFASGLAWRDPDRIFAPSPAQLREFLAWAMTQPFTVFDVETFAGFQEAAHFEPMEDRLKCIGIGNEIRAVVIPFRSVEPGHPPYYSREEQSQIVELVKGYAIDPRFKKAGWNSRYYDRMVFEARLGVIPAPHLDGIIIHRVAEPEMRHNLGFAGSIYTDVDKWKAGHAGTKAASDLELFLYNVKDIAVTALSIPPLVEVARQRKQDHLIPVFQKLQDVCVGLHQNGIPVDQAVRREWDKKLLIQAEGHRKRIRELANSSSLNPASFAQIADLLFERLGIAPHHYSEQSGEPSTDDDSLRAFLSDTWGLDPRRKALISAIRDFRRVTKRRGVVVRLRPITEEAVTADDLAEYGEEGEGLEARFARLEEERDRKKKGRARAPGLVLPDGRVHADWNPFGTTGWRFSSSNPNLQNVEPKIRDMFVAPPGFVFVGCDEAQLELRMVAGMAGAKYYIDAFKADADPHKNLCIDVFGDRFLKASKEHQKKLRVCVKQLTYGSLYGAEDKVKHEIITSAEDEDETLLFPDFTMREVSAFSQAWFRRVPEIPAWWDSLVAEHRRLGYLAEPIMGLKCDFLDGPGSEGFLNRLYNYKAQSGGSALVHLATFRALEEIPFFKWGKGTGLVQQGHDSLVFQVPQDHARYRDGEDTKENPIDREFGFCGPGCKCRANRVAGFLQECMTESGQRYGMDMKFVGEAGIGKTLKAV